MSPKPISQDRTLQAYVLGLALGDGNLTNPNGRAPRLRITCDAKYPRLALKIAEALQALLPQNKVSYVRRHAHYFDISCFSNHLEGLLGWKAGNGPKRVQRAAVPRWVFDRESYKISCLRGLLETDGSIYDDRGYGMVMFSNACPELARDTYDLMKSLGFGPRMYRIERRSPQNPIYHVRLSRRVSEFLLLVQPDKS